MINKCMSMCVRAVVAFIIAAVGSMQCLHAEELKLLKTLGVKEDKVNTVAFSPDGTFLAYARKNDLDFVELATPWDMNSAKPLSKIPGSHTPLLALFLPDGKSVLAAPGSPTPAPGPKTSSLAIWDVATGKQLVAVSGQIPYKGYGLVFSPDGKRFAAPATYQVKIWSTATGKITMVLGDRVGKMAPNHLRFSTDGKRLASVDDGGSMKLWDVDSGKMIATGSVTGTPLSFSPDLKLLAVAAKDGTLELREMPGGAAGKKQAIGRTEP